MDADTPFMFFIKIHMSKEGYTKLGMVGSTFYLERNNGIHKTESKNKMYMVW